MIQVAKRVKSNIEKLARFVDKEETIRVKLHRQRTCIGTDIPSSQHRLVTGLQRSGNTMRDMISSRIIREMKVVSGLMKI